jgi:hypothetical protein
MVRRRGVRCWFGSVGDFGFFLELKRTEQQSMREDLMRRVARVRVNVSKVRFFKRCNVQKRTPDPCQFPPFAESVFLLGGSFMQSLRPSLASAEGISSYERARNPIAVKCRQQAGNKRAS